jgi:hypothetical protein
MPTQRECSTSSAIPPSSTTATIDPHTGRALLRLVVLASIIVSFFAASSAPTPLYAAYQAAWHFSSLAGAIRRRNPYSS